MMRPLYLTLLLIPIGVAFRYCVELTQAARLVGIAIASPAYLSINKNGFQGAVTPPESNKWFYSSIVLLIGAVGWLWFSFGWADALIGVVVAFVSGTVAQVTFLPKQDSRHFVLRIFGSMARRAADYERDGDAARARAMTDLLDKFAVQYGGMIAKDPASAHSRITQPSNGEAVLARANRASVWVSWYFRRGPLTIVTVPLFLLLVYSTVVSAVGSLVKGLALLRASYAVFGAFGALAALSVGWVPVIMPPVLWYGLTKHLPGLWLRPDASRRTKVVTSIAVLASLPLAAYLIHHVVVLAIGWIADRDPCAALAAGVTGSKPPTKCP
jgi:hypothetical protein